jgi:peptidyl-dipeptidase A
MKPYHLHIQLTRESGSLNAQWFGTAHHELGHIYYYLSYSVPEVPVLLREGARHLSL